MTNEEILKQFIANQNSPNTKLCYRYELERFFKFVGHKKIDNITFDDVLNYKTNIQHFKLQTQHVLIDRVKSLFRFCERMGHVQKDITRVISTPKTCYEEPAVLGIEECRFLLRLVEMETGKPPEVKLRDYVIINLFLATGLRRIEMSRLNINSFTQQNGYNVIYVWGKGNKERVIKLQDSIAELIQRYITKFRAVTLPDDPLFIKGDGTDGRLTDKTLERIVKYYIDKAEFKKKKKKRISCHTLRHTCFTLELTHGANIKEIMEQAGHASIATTHKYIHITDKLKNSASDKNPLFAPPGIKVDTHGIMTGKMGGTYVYKNKIKPQVHSLVE